MAIAKEQIRQIITENNFTNVADVYDYLKEGFKDILQELMEAEMDAVLGYEKNHKGDITSNNCKSQYKNVGLLQNKNVIKPTFLFCIFSPLLI